MKKIISFMTLYCCCLVMAFSQDLTRKIENITQGKQASIGVAIIYGDQTLTIANDRRYPIMSVFKLPIALTALKKMEADHISLDDMVYIEQDRILKNTYSPLREKYPDQGVYLSYRDIIKYTIIYSDNNTCDWLIHFVGGINKVDSYMKLLGIADINLTETENDMHQDITKCYNNWSTPLAMAQLLQKIHTENILNETHFIFLKESLLNCASGKDKLIAGLPSNIKLGHKTGHSDRTDDGIQIGDADAGVIYLPNGETCYIVVLIKDSRESDRTNAKIMADIGNITYQHLIKQSEQPAYSQHVFE